MSVLSVLCPLRNQRDDEYHAASEKDDAADKAQGTAALNTGDYKKYGTYQEEKPAPELKLPVHFSVFGRHGQIIRVYQFELLRAIIV